MNLHPWPGSPDDAALFLRGAIAADSSLYPAITCLLDERMWWRTVLDNLAQDVRRNYGERT